MALPAGRGWLGQSGKFYAALAEELIAFAEHVFRKNRKTQDGATESEHGEAAARIARKLGRSRPEGLNASSVAPFPPSLRYLWQWFEEISLGLSGGGFGPPLVTWESLKAWREAMQIEIDPWEARLLVRLGYRRAVIMSEK